MSARHVLRAAALFSFTVALAASSHKCVNSPGGTKCGDEVQSAMLEGFAKQPDRFVGLTVHSSYTDFQAYFHNAGMHDCPRPCFPREEKCVKFSPEYPGIAKVNWARNVGMDKHPEWYPELSTKSTDKEIAKALYMHGIDGCPRICEDDEDEGHFEPFSEGIQMAKSEDWMAVATSTPTSTLPDLQRHREPMWPSEEAKATAAPTVAPTEPPTPAPMTEPATKATTVATTEAITTAPPTTTVPPTTTPPPTKKTTDEAGFIVDAPLPAIPSGSHEGEVIEPQTSPVQEPDPSKVPAVKEPSIQKDCTRAGRSFSLLDCLNHLPTIMPSSASCQDHCAKQEYAAYFLYHVPLSLCHCPPDGAEPVEDMGADFIGGDLSCTSNQDYVKRNDADVPAFGTVPRSALAVSGNVLAAALVAALITGIAVASRFGTRLVSQLGPRASQPESARLLDRYEDAAA